MLIEFARPLLLLALLLLLVLPRVKGWLWRAVALSLLIVALAGPERPLPSQRVAVILDVSESVGTRSADALANLDLSNLQEAAKFFAFAGDTTQLVDLEQEEAVTAISTSQTGQQAELLKSDLSDIARSLQVAQASDVDRILIISDGAESAGDALAALPKLPVDSIYIQSRDNSRLSGLLAPEEAGVGENVKVIAVVESDRATEATLIVTINGEDQEPITQQLSSGRTPIDFNFTVEDEGNIELSARLVSDYDQAKADDTARVDISVNEAAPVLVIGDPAAAALLKVQGFNVVEGSPANISSTTDYSAIVLRDSANSFSLGQLELLTQYVQSGGGLLMTGGPNSFGLGGWYRSPVEDVLPVNTDLRTDVEIPLVAMVMVLDRSQSMQSGQPSKIDLAKEGAIAVVDLAYQEDILGLIVFSDKEEWIFQPRPATERGKREMARGILDIETQGGTVLRPAFTEAIDTLNNTEAAIKHIILLTDGQLYDSPFNNNSNVDFAMMANLAYQDGITTSSIGIGNGADVEQLERISAAGKGRFYAALDVSTLPQIFATEALTATRSLLREQVTEPIIRTHPLIPEGLSAAGNVPSLNAYIASSLKRDSEMLLEGLDKEPILAVSRQGLGRSAAFTTDLNTWSGNLGNWTELPALLGTVTRWLQARPSEYSSKISAEGTGFRVVVDAVADGEYINGEVLTARYQGQEIEPEQSAPGRYEAFIDDPTVGATVLIRRDQDVVARTPVNIANREYDNKNGQSLLNQISSLTGGSVLSFADSGLLSYNPAMKKRATSIWHFFAMAGFGIFFLELILRRFDNFSDLFANLLNRNKAE